MMKKLAFLSLFLAASLTTPANSAKIDFSTLLTDLAGAPIPNCQPNEDCSKAKPITLGDAAVMALTAAFVMTEKPGADEKFKRWLIAEKIYGQKEVDLKPEEIATIKELIGKVYGPVVIGRAWEILNQGAKE